MVIMKHFDELTINELYEILKLRNEVFIVEQTCIYQDIDDKDLDAYHLFIKEDNTIKAYLRILKTGLSYKNTPSIGRVLVPIKYRSMGYGRIIMNKAKEYIYTTMDDTSITISAQEYLLDFYTSLGFVKASESYLEDDIPHIKMIHTK